ncbi:hypothetical protein B0O80DRAFT_476002, partial [Mortierella sp. GBAus27b]
MTDPSRLLSLLGPPTHTIDVEPGFSNGHLASGDELPSTGDAHVIDLPTDRPRPAQGSTVSSDIPIILDVPLTRSLKRLAMDHGMDIGIVAVTGWSAVLSRLSGQDDIVIGFHSDTFGQSHTKYSEDRILPLRMDLSGEPNTTQLLCRAWELVSPVMTHQGLPSGRISDVDNPSRRANVSPAFQVVFQWQSQERHSSTLKKSPLSGLHLELQLQLQESDNEVKGSIQFSTALFDLNTIRRHAGYLITTLKSMAEDPTRPVATFEILTPPERKLVLETWNNTCEPYPDHLCFHQLFELQSDKTPSATAIVHESGALSYSELNARANRLAHHLIGLGVCLETRVAICAERSPGMIVGVLAIMKAGGTYVPIDPDYAGGRVSDILQDASPTIAVADKTGQGVLRDSALMMVDPDTLLTCPTSNPSVLELTSRNLVYIIYTSGSTGKPKGVMIEHRGVVNLAQTHTKFCGIQPSSRMLQFASCGFDTSVWEILLPLTNGASLYLPPAIVRKDRKEFWE